MAIHGYKENGRPMFDDVNEWCEYERVVEIQRIANQNKFDHCCNMADSMQAMQDALQMISFCGVTDEAIAKLDEAKNRLDLSYEKIESAPEERGTDTALIDEYLSKIIILDGARLNEHFIR